MDLKEFVTETLAQIVEGVRAAQQRCGDAAGINPRTGRENDTGRVFPNVDFFKGAKLQDVEFDVAIAASEESTLSADGGARLVVASITGKGSLSQASSSVSRIKFMVPIGLPTASER